MEFKAHYSGSKGNLYSVTSDSGEILLIDPGVSIRKIRECVDMDNVVGALVSHSHKDHCAGVTELMRSGVDIYLSVETSRQLGLGDLHHRVYQIGQNDIVHVPPFRVRCFPTQHDCPGSVGFYVACGSDRLLYVTDSPFVTPRFAGLTHVAIETNWSNQTMSEDIHPGLELRIRHSHMSLERAVDLLLANDLSRVREIWLLHLSDGNSDAQMFLDRVTEETGKPVYVA